MRVKVNGKDDGEREREREEEYVDPGMQYLESYKTNKRRHTTRDKQRSKQEQDGRLWDHGLITIGEFDEEESTDGCLERNRSLTLVYNKNCRCLSDSLVKLVQPWRTQQQRGLIGVGTRRPNTIQSKDGGKTNDLNHDGKVARIHNYFMQGWRGRESMERYSNSVLLGISFCLLDERE